MTSPELSTIEVGNKLSDAESALIGDLKTDAFDIDAQKEDIDEMKESLKTSKINVITSAVGITPEVKTLLSLSEIATAFATYVEQGEGWKLKLKEKDAAGTDLLAPEWIKYIIANPEKNDLAYFIQQLAGLIEYQTAKAYTATELTAVEVGVDKAFGNQTKRALAGLKNWIENDQDYKTVTEGSVYTGKYLDKTFVEGVISTQKTDAEKNIVLAKYNLQYKDAKIQPIEGYVFIDKNSNNLAVKGESDLIPENIQPVVNIGLAVDSGDFDDYSNHMMKMDNINQLPNATGDYTRSETLQQMYYININGKSYSFWCDGYGTTADGTRKKTKDIIAESFKNSVIVEKVKTIGTKTELTADGAELRKINNVGELLSLIDKNGEYRWAENKAYECVINGKTCRFYNNNRVNPDSNDKNKPMENSNTFIAGLNKTAESKDNMTESIIAEVKDVPAKIDEGKKYTKRNYNSRGDMTFYSDGHFMNGYDASKKEVRGNRYKMADGSTIMKYDSETIECSTKFIDANKKINYEVLQNILTIVATAGEEYGINTSGVLMKGKQSPEEKFYPAGYYVKKGNLYKSIKRTDLTYAYQYIYNKKSDDFTEIGEYVTSGYSGSYQIKEQYRV